MEMWLDHMQQALDGDEDAVLITVAHVRGSTPREVGAHMVVTSSRVLGTIGGGNLEYRAIDQAREMLIDHDHRPMFQDYPLGPALGQCCGGVASLMFEPLDNGSREWIDLHTQALKAGEKAISVVSLNQGGRRLMKPSEGVTALIPAEVRAQAEDILQAAEPAGRYLEGGDGASYFLEPLLDDRTPLYLFGAGHVGHALVRLLAELPFKVHWVDSRAEQFDEFSGMHSGNMRVVVAADPVSVVTEAPKGAFYLVMTHDHGLDLEICAAILARGDFNYAGLIGSDTKRARFERRLKARGIKDITINNLVCPIGVDGISGKRPAEVALATAAQLQIVRERILAGHREYSCDTIGEFTE
ncbi:xanthine dehydrogenase accessory protein XdhC [Aestuariispira ectoiniformans]|uniref:xanthine dehydrogenase accessory protein XdhC n=1 Tax=Aestuariispira ectoiniformans TaxID=2775080 RepID=UPI00223C0C26|nr:xanthine dehydrogenase accessory protein XdhC [Aestuariispira ectoiniformans]